MCAETWFMSASKACSNCTGSERKKKWVNHDVSNHIKAQNTKHEAQ
jgi:hypothetical protein